MKELEKVFSEVKNRNSMKLAKSNMKKVSTQLINVQKESQTYRKYGDRNNVRLKN